MLTKERGAQFGDLKRFEVRVGGENIASAVVSVEVYQDMFSPVTTGAVIIRDTNNLLMNLPIIPGSPLGVEIETDIGSVGDGTTSWSFVIYKIGDKTVTNSKDQLYTLYVADEAYFKNQNTRVWKSYKMMPPNKIAEDIIGSYLGGSSETTDTDNPITTIIPGWTPFYALAWLQKVALASRQADVVFFQRGGRFCFLSFEQMYSDRRFESGITFTFRPTNIRKDGDYDVDYSTVVNRYHFDHFDAMSNIASGFYRNKVVSYDFIDKSWSTHDFTYGDDNTDDKMANPYNFDVSGDSNISFVPTHPDMIDPDILTYLDYGNEWQSSRKSAIMKFEQEKLIIQIPGSAAAAGWFGRTCEVDLPSQDFESKDKYDKHRRGKYLITSMGHIISGAGYVVNAECVKKRLEQ